MYTYEVVKRGRGSPPVQRDSANKWLNFIGKTHLVYLSYLLEHAWSQESYVTDYVEGTDTFFKGESLSHLPQWNRPAAWPGVSNIPALGHAGWERTIGQDNKQQQLESGTLAFRWYRGWAAYEYLQRTQEAKDTDAIDNSREQTV